MIDKEPFELIEAGHDLWDVQHRGTIIVAGQVSRVHDEFALYDWLGKSFGVFPTVSSALDVLLTASGGPRRTFSRS